MTLARRRARGRDPRGRRRASVEGDLPVSRVRDAMIADPVSLDASATAQEAGQHLVQPDVRAVYVSESGRFVGVVTRKTLVERVVAAGQRPADDAGRRARRAAELDDRPGAAAGRGVRAAGGVGRRARSGRGRRQARRRALAQRAPAPSGRGRAAGRARRARGLAREPVERGEDLVPRLRAARVTVVLHDHEPCIRPRARELPGGVERRSQVEPAVDRGRPGSRRAGPRPGAARPLRARPRARSNGRRSARTPAAPRRHGRCRRPGGRRARARSPRLPMRPRRPPPGRAPPRRDPPCAVHKRPHRRLPESAPTPRAGSGRLPRRAIRSPSAGWS